MLLSEQALALVKEIGMGEQEAYDLGRQFFAVYPDNWETMLLERLEQRRGQSTENIRIAEKRELIRAKENQLRALDRVNLEKSLDKRLKDLDKMIEDVTPEPTEEPEVEPKTEEWRKEKSAEMGAGGVNDAVQ
jgi:hypothetical protein